jgi:hypothetical protein
MLGSQARALGSRNLFAESGEVLAAAPASLHRLACFRMTAAMRRSCWLGSGTSARPSP